MGNFWAKVKRGLYWIYNIIKKIIEWLCSYVKTIFKKIAFFLNKHEEKIKSADNPKKVAKIFAIDMTIKNLEEARKEVVKGSTQRDLDLCREMFDDDKDFEKSVDSDFLDKEIEKIIKENNII